MVGFRREYGLDWREARRTLWHGDLAALVEGLDEWTRTDENIARLVDREDYWLNSEYAGWIHDPDDPDTKRRAAERRKRGIKPPPTPILFPVAARPDTLHTELMTLAQQQITEHNPPRPAAPGEGAGRRKISIRELQAMRGK